MMFPVLRLLMLIPELVLPEMTLRATAVVPPIVFPFELFAMCTPP